MGGGQRPGPRERDVDEAEGCAYRLWCHEQGLARAAAKIADFHIVGLADVDPLRAKRLAEQFSLQLAVIAS